MEFQKQLKLKVSTMNKLLFILSICALACSCSDKSQADKLDLKMVEIKGTTMATYYVVKYITDEARVTKKSIDSLLVQINSSINTYDSSSVISSFNQTIHSEPILITEDSSLIKYFVKNYKYAEDIYNRSGGSYDPTITPLVNHWGFGYVDRERARNTDPKIISGLLEHVGFNHLSLISEYPLRLVKRIPELTLDFSSVAKGQAVDEIGALIESKGISNYYVEIGGECRARGKKPQSYWTVGISFPDTSAMQQDIITKFPLINGSVASSGNYRNYYKSGGVVYAHTISPETGFPEWNDLLSASIFTESCGYADAIATACMAMGSERCITMIENIEGVEGYLVVGDDHGNVREVYSTGAEKMINK